MDGWGGWLGNGWDGLRYTLPKVSTYHINNSRYFSDTLFQQQNLFLCATLRCFLSYGMPLCET
jgi:hypothetical protein